MPKQWKDISIWMKTKTPDGALKNLDKKFDKWLSDKEVSRGKKVRKMTTC